MPAPVTARRQARRPLVALSTILAVIAAGLLAWWWNIEHPTTFLLLEAMRRMDEEGQDLS